MRLREKDFCFVTGLLAALLMMKKTTSHWREPGGRWILVSVFSSLEVLASDVA